MSDALLQVDGLCVGFDDADGRAAHLPVIEDLSFTLARNRTLALVGESGCGKSLTALAVLGLLPAFARVTSGAIRLDGEDLTGLDDARMTRLRGNRISMVFQEPMSALNPVFTVGWQITEALRLHRAMTKAEARERAIESLASVGIPDPVARAGDYPHQLSGGMRQRVMIAMALACDPDILIADEPTTALDVTIQAQIIDLMLDLQDRLGTGILFISHDFGVVSHVADEIAVMYAGRVVEHGSAADVIDGAQHPYTRALLNTTPRIEHSLGVLPAIAGRVPAPDERGAGCPFEPRCTVAGETCAMTRPEQTRIAAGHHAACHAVARV
ncbi:MAG TPA: ABC transporter ATP-binding protein [Pseudomonadales bacterium]|nr:ABC transporter ATP-binding protein [Pseudomonadales bacterium]